jgi:hypothetical protein
MPDNAPILALGARLQRDIAERNELIDRQIEMGWGGTEPKKIPANWRDIRGPEKKYTAIEKERIREGRRRSLQKKQKFRGSRKSRSNPKCFVPKGA